jgi:DNA polymerase-3 subunit gamma/tau
VTIAAGTSIDVIEMDAASNRSVDDVRDLRERVAYAAAGGRWKVYILDEAHMLTKEAWNAFLKTLEEPPPNTVFVLATTESHKVMATIADRCQRFDFQRPSLEQISEVLRRVAAAEGIEIEDGAVAMVSRSASGSFRDALGTLGQLVSFGGSQVKLDAVLELLGAVEAELLFGAVDAVVAEDPKAVLLEVEKMAQSGRDPAQFARDLLAHLRHLLVAQTIGDVPESFVVTATDAGRMTAQAAAISAAGLVRTIDELSAALTAVREGDDARMAVEIALLKAARPDLDPSTEGLLRRIERLEQKLGGAPSLPAAASVREDVESTAEAPEPEAAAETNVAGGGADLGDPSEEAAQPPPQDGGIQIGDRTRGPDSVSAPAVPDTPADLDQIARIWPAMLDQLGKEAPALVAVFEGARPVAVDGDALKIGFPASSTFNKRKAEAPDKRELVSMALQTVLGQKLRPVYVLLEDEPERAGAPKEEKLDEQELLERLKSEFDAEEVG